jgi:hypothetical protein
MLFFLTLLIAQTTFAENYSIFRLEPQHNQAVIATINANQFSVGNEFNVETPQGICQLIITKIVTDYIYVNTEQCQREYLGKGTPVIPQKSLITEKALPAPIEPLSQSPDLTTENVTTESDFTNSDFYNAYIAKKLSTTLSYLTGNTLEGRALINSTTAIEDIKGSNTIALGFDYAFWKLPYNLSLSAGMNYSLPRSYGRYQLRTLNGSQTVNFNNTPKLQTLSLFSNVRYQWDEKTWAYFGINHMFADSSGLPGDISGDFGFHLGARHYVLENFFAEGSLNFYNLDYEVQNRTADFSLTELEIKAGYTF